MVNGVPLAKNPWSCGPLVFGLGTSLGTPFTTIPTRLFQIMSHYSFLSFLNICWLVFFTMFVSINYLLVTMENADIKVINTMDKKKYLGKVTKKRQIST